MALTRKRKRNSDSSVEPKLKAIYSSDEEDTPTPYQILLDSIPVRRENQLPKEQSPSTAINTEEHFSEDDIIDNTADDGSDCSLDETDTTLANDPYVSHFDNVLEETDIKSLKELYSQSISLNKIQHKEFGLIQWLATPINTKGWAPIEISNQKSLRELFVREPMATLWSTCSRTSTEKPFSPLQNNLFDILNSYKDLLYTKKTFQNDTDIREMYVLHLLNHVLKNRTRVLKNNIRLTLAAKEGRQLGEIKDQGLIRPKVLILVPFRNSALKIVSTMISLFIKPGKGEVANKKKFFDFFGEGEKVKEPKHKPESYRQYFSGNVDDCFRVGVSIKKSRMKLFTSFYSSDIIIASPLGLRTIVGAEGDKKRDTDFLSSLEMIIVDSADIFLMQNWDHILHIFEHIHLQPTDGHGVDFSRVREWSLNCWAQYYCQLLVFASFPTPEINSLFSSHAQNYEGQVRIQPLQWVGSVNDIFLSIPQIFHSLKCVDHLQLPQIRFQYFIDIILPKFTDSDISNVCIYIPSYFDFVRLRNHFKKEGLSYCHISEYTKYSNVSRARTYFTDGRRKYLLITERLHFFRRYRLKAIKNLVFYAPPTYSEFYSELVNQMEEDTVNKCNGQIIVLCSQYDSLALQRIIGNDRTSTLLKSDSSVHTILIS